MPKAMACGWMIVRLGLCPAKTFGAEQWRQRQAACARSFCGQQRAAIERLGRHGFQYCKSQTRSSMMEGHDRLPSFCVSHAGLLRIWPDVGDLKGCERAHFELQFCRRRSARRIRATCAIGSYCFMRDVFRTRATLRHPYRQNSSLLSSPFLLWATAKKKYKL